MGIRCYCPQGHKLNVKNFQAGKRGVCPYCGEGFRIPLESTRKSSGQQKAEHELVTGGGPVPPSRSPAAPPAVGDEKVSIHLNQSAGGGPGDDTPDVDLAAVLNAPGGFAPSLPTSGSASPAPESPAVSPASTFPQTAPADVASARPEPASRTRAVTPETGTPTAAPMDATSPEMPTPASEPEPASPSPAATVAAADPEVVDALAESPDAVWYVRPAAGGQFGPAVGTLMRMWIEEGRVSSDSLIWREGWRDWRNAAVVFPELASGSEYGPFGVTPPAPVEPTTAGTDLAALRGSTRRRSNNTAIFVTLLLLAVIVLVVVLYWVLTREGAPETSHHPDRQCRKPAVASIFPRAPMALDSTGRRAT
ncbi:MAG: DUF4339 domain-containing protein [Planctomycetes bacterium]|nr:DUF4339 domain-containing protein [Planctomycetota bacterium]